MELQNRESFFRWLPLISQRYLADVYKYLLRESQLLEEPRPPDIRRRAQWSMSIVAFMHIKCYALLSISCNKLARLGETSDLVRVFQTQDASHILHLQRLHIRSKFTETT